MLRRIQMVAVATVMLAPAIVPASVAAQPAPPPLPANAQVVAGGLLNPRGFAWGSDGKLYVAEAGSPPAGYKPPQGLPPADAPPVINNNGRISRIDDSGARTTIADGLPTMVGPLGDMLGPAGVAFVGDTLYAIISAGPKHGHPDFAGGVYEIGMDGSVSLVADTDAYNVANPPISCSHCGGAGDELSNPYDILALDGKLYITDGNKDVIHVVDPAAPEGERISRLADVSPGGHKVLTGLSLGTDGNLYATNLGPLPFRAGVGMVRQITLDGEVSEISAGLTAATGIAIASDGTMYVTEIAMSTGGQPPFLAPPGRVVIAADDATGPVATPLMFPTITRIGPDGALYVANFSVGGDQGNGSIVRVNT